MIQKEAARVGAMLTEEYHATPAASFSFRIERLARLKRDHKAVKIHAPFGQLIPIGIFCVTFIECIASKYTA